MEPGPKRLVELPGARRALAEAGLGFMDALHDPARALLWAPEGSGQGRHLVRESAWYALGCLLRGRAGDRNHAVAMLEAVCGAQLDAPATAWHGTFARAPEDPLPQHGARIWLDYDPNWRQFIGATLAVALGRFHDELPRALRERLERTLALAVAGETAGRVSARYSNVALLKAWLEVEVGALHGDVALAERGTTLAGEIAALFDVHEAFDEYNSPTYYGVDLLALALWRISSSPRLRELGASLESLLWEDVARFYHAGLRNLAGPYTRAYGMDLGTYVGALGLWIAADVGPMSAPLPDLARPFAHAHDLCLAPLVALLGPRVPASARAALRRFEGARLVERRIADDPRRVASAWLEDDLMIGAETNTADWGRWDQYHAVTVHWRAPAGSVAWIRLHHPGRIEARAAKRALTLVLHDSQFATTPTRFEIGGVDPIANDCRAERWQLPGLDVGVETDAGFAGAKAGPTYARGAPSRFRLTLDPD